MQYETIRALGLALIAALCSPGAAQDAGPRENGSAGTVATKRARPQPETVAALRRARDAESKAKGLRGTERKAALAAAAQAYERVASEHADDPVGVARAWFGAAETWRRHGSVAKAEAGYKKACEAKNPSLVERAWLGAAHMQRRLENFDAALSSYQKVAASKSGTSRVHEARIWVGRCLESLGKTDAAIKSYEAALESTKQPRRVVDVCNRLALALVRAGRLDDAAAVIQRAEKAVPSGDDKEAKRVRQAFQKMSARRSLQRAFDKKNAAHAAAEDLDKARSGR